MKYEVSVIAPCRNEAGNLQELVQRLQAVFEARSLRGQIVLINDASTDDTGEIIDRMAAEHPDVVAIHHETNRGIAEGWRSGLKASEGEYICLIDADLQYIPEDVWRLYREIRISGVDIAQGYRSSIGRLKDGRYVLSKGLNFLLNTLFGMKLRDNKSGFILCRKEVLADVLRYRFRYRYFQTFLLVAAHARGHTIREVETLFESRLVGQSFIPRFPLKLLLGVLLDFVPAFREFRISDKPRTLIGEFLDEHDCEIPPGSTTGWRRGWLRIYAYTMPLHAWTISRNVLTYYDELQRSQWLSPQQIRDLQHRKLCELIHHAYHHVGYYREVFDRHGLRPGDIKTAEDLQKLPLLDKSTVRRYLHFDLLSNNYNKRKIRKITTSGSTGEPFVCYVEKQQLEMRWAATLRGMEWAGYRFGDRHARLWHQTIGMTGSQVLREQIDAWMSRRLFIPAYEMSDRSLEKMIKELRRYDPVLIDGYAESFNFLAHWIRRNGIKGVRPKGIISSAQSLPDRSREMIEKEFGCRVFDKYGSREFSGIAWESDAHDGHLVVAENSLVEILKDGRPAMPGEIGEVIVTDLNNYVMPFIRYRVGDLAVAMDPNSRSSCGRGLPRIGKIEGRVQAIILGTNGSYLPGTFFAHIFKDHDHVVRQYQVVQENRDGIRLKIVKAPRFTEGGFRTILDELYQFLGDDMKIRLEFVDRIPMGRTGKHQGVISRLDLDFQKLRESVHSDAEREAR